MCLPCDKQGPPERDDIAAFFSKLRSFRSNAVTVILQHYRDEGTVIPSRKLLETLKGYETYKQLPCNITKNVIQDLLGPLAGCINPVTRRLKRQHGEQDGYDRPKSNE